MSEQVYDGKKTVGGVVPTIEQKGQSLNEKKTKEMQEVEDVLNALLQKPKYRAFMPIGDKE